MRRLAVRAFIGLWLVGIVAAWNVVFDDHVEAGARDYVDRQALFVKGQGPRADMDAVMREAVSSGARSATGYALLIVVPGMVVLALAGRRIRT